MNSFEEKVVVVTGAGSGIGRAIALTFSRLGAVAVLADRDEERVSGVSKEIEEEGGISAAFCVDVSQREQMGAFAKKVIEKFKRVDVLINSAGVLLLGEMRIIPFEDFQWAMGVNFWGAVHGIYSFLPIMIKRRKGHIVNISSTNGLVPLPYACAYNASKSALFAVSETLRMEIVHQGIGVTSVCPGLTQTYLHENARYATETEKTREFLDSLRKRAKQKGVDPFKVARKIPPAILRNRAVVRISAETFIFSLLYRFLPRFYRFGMRKVVKRTT